MFNKQYQIVALRGQEFAMFSTNYQLPGMLTKVLIKTFLGILSSQNLPPGSALIGSQPWTEGEGGRASVLRTCAVNGLHHHRLCEYRLPSLARPSASVAPVPFSLSPFLSRHAFRALPFLPPFLPSFHAAKLAGGKCRVSRGGAARPPA